jgi:hypothetical protein
MPPRSKCERSRSTIHIASFKVNTQTKGESSSSVNTIASLIILIVSKDGSGRAYSLIITK